MTEWELHYIETQISIAATSSDAPTQLSNLLSRVRSLQTDEPRIMGMCMRLSRVIQYHLQTCKRAEADQHGPYVWIEDVEAEERSRDAIERIRHAVVAHRALMEVSEIMQFVVSSSKIGHQGRLRPSSLRASLSRIEDILGDAKLTRFLRLHINARIVHRLFTAALTQSNVAATSSKSVQSKRVDSPIVTSFAGKIKPFSVSSIKTISLPSISLPKVKHVNIVKPFVDSDSEDYGDLDSEDDVGASADSSASSSPQTPLDSAFSQTSAKVRSLLASTSKRMSSNMSIIIPSTPRLPWLIEESSVNSDDSDDDFDLDERLREAAREETLRKLCRESEWVKSIRDAEPLVLAKRPTRISVIPSLLTVGEVDEEDV